MDEKDEIRLSIAAYEAEISNLRYFLREKRSISDFQDWVWRRMPKLTAKTTKLRPSTRILGRWEDGCTDMAVRYTDLLTLLCKIGDVERVRYPHTTTYRWRKE